MDYGLSEVVGRVRTSLEPFSEGFEHLQMGDTSLLDEFLFGQHK